MVEWLVLSKTRMQREFSNFQRDRSVWGKVLR